jgi:ParB-like chromosome segregation protein Spo0J
MEYSEFFNKLKELDIHEQIEEINKIKLALHEISPFKNEPVDCVLWVKNTETQANDYNPNVVAPPEMKLLELSISSDGYTQPVVTWIREDGTREVIDGFHRNRIGKESLEVMMRTQGYLPVTTVNQNRHDRGDRISSTIRHNRARGKHVIGKMSDIVVELKRRNWSTDKICKHLGMDPDEVLRLCQITGLAELFADQDFSKSWDIEDSEPEFIPIDDDILVSEDDKFRTVNTGDKDRIFHTHDKWECAKAGFYATTKEGMTRQQCEEEYFKLLTDLDKFSDILEKVITEWKNSCEHYLTNSSMNRIAWLGQAALCYATGIPSTFRGGFNLLTRRQQRLANETALRYLNKWLKANGRNEVAMDDAISSKQMDLY